MTRLVEIEYQIDEKETSLKAAIQGISGPVAIYERSPLLVQETHTGKNNSESLLLLYTPQLAAGSRLLGFQGGANLGQRRG